MSGLYVGTETYPSYFGLSISDRRYRWYFWEFNISGTSAIFLRVKKIGVTDDIFERSTYRRYWRYFESKLFNYTKCRKNIGDNGEMFMILGTNSLLITAINRSGVCSREQWENRHVTIFVSSTAPLLGRQKWSRDDFSFHGDSTGKEFPSTEESPNSRFQQRSMSSQWPKLFELVSLFLKDVLIFLGSL